MEKLETFDFFAKKIGLTFQGKVSYTTPIGGLISIICFTVATFLFLVKTVDLVSKADPELSMIESESKSARSDLYELGFMIAVQNIDPRIGKIQTSFEQWPINGNR